MWGCFLWQCHVEVGNLVQGELRTSGLPYEFEEDESNENHSDSSPEEFHDGNYAVSPRELAKRLHEVLALQQEQQISDLETQLKLMEIKLQNKEAELQFLKLGPVDRFQGTACMLYLHCLSKRQSVVFQSLVRNVLQIISC